MMFIQYNFHRVCELFVDFDTSGIQKPPPDVNEMVDDDRIISYLMKHPRQKDKIEQEMTLHGQ